MATKNTKAETIRKNIIHSIVNRRNNDVQFINQNFLGILEEYGFDTNKAITIVFKNEIYFSLGAIENPYGGYIAKVICVEGIVKFIGYLTRDNKETLFTADDLYIGDGTFFEFVKILTSGLQELRDEEEVTITLTRTKKDFLDMYLTKIGDLLMDGDEISDIKTVMEELDIKREDNDEVGKMLKVDWCC